MIDTVTGFYGDPGFSNEGIVNTLTSGVELEKSMSLEG
jgi:hypothetical protein